MHELSFNKFSGYLVGLGCIFAIVAGVYAWMPYNMRWEEVSAYREALNGSPSRLYEMRRLFETYESFKIGFGIASLITLFLGFALKRSSSGLSPEESVLCPYCKERIKLGALVCKHCGKDQPPANPNDKLHWTCPSCNAISRGHMTECGVCNHPRPDDVVFKDMTWGKKQAL